MNDEELMMLVRSQRDQLTMSVPIERIIGRGRMLRARRRAPIAAAGLATVAGAALAVDTLSPAGTPPSHSATQSHRASPNSASASLSSNQPTVRLAAWSVDELADGNISVTLRQLRDPSGLQATLRADGVRASVTFSQLNTACRPYPASTPLLDQVFPDRSAHLPTAPAGASHLSAVSASATPPSPTPPLPAPDDTVVVIDPSALPSDAAVQLAASANSTAVLLPQLVYASSQCSGD